MSSLTSNRVTVGLTKRQNDLLQREAARRGVGFAEQIRTVLDDWLDNRVEKSASDTEKTELALYRLLSAKYGKGRKR